MVWSSSNYYFADINEVTLLYQDQPPSSGQILYWFSLVS